MFGRPSSSVMERLESRTLFSHGADDPIVIEDRQILHDHLAEYAAHRVALSTQLKADLVALKAAIRQRAIDVAPLVQKLVDDKNAGSAQLADDKAALKAALLADKQVIVADLQAIRDHRGNELELADDRVKFADDRNAMLGHLHDGLELIHQHRGDLSALLLSDKQAIVSHLHTDSTGMIVARQAFDDHKHQGELELEDDRGQINDDIIKLHNDDGPNHT